MCDAPQTGIARFRGRLRSWREKEVHDGERTAFRSTEFREQMVDLVRAGRSPEELGQEFGVSGQTIRNWLKQADVEAGRRADGLSSEEQYE